MGEGVGKKAIEVYRFLFTTSIANNMEIKPWLCYRPNININSNMYEILETLTFVLVSNN